MQQQEGASGEVEGNVLEASFPSEPLTQQLEGILDDVECEDDGAAMDFMEAKQLNGGSRTVTVRPHYVANVHPLAGPLPSAARGAPRDAQVRLLGAGYEESDREQGQGQEPLTATQSALDRLPSETGGVSCSERLAKRRRLASADAVEAECLNAQ